MKSTTYSQFCMRVFKNVCSKIEKGKISEKNLLLEKANIAMVCKEYYALSMMNALLAALVCIFTAVFFYFFLPSHNFPLLLFILSPCVSLSIWGLYQYMPIYCIKKRAASIDRFLPYSVNFISTMSETGVSPAEIFRTLSTIDIYGEIQQEAKKISKEIDMMGVDNISALQHGIERSPSKKFKSFLQGLLGTLQSGSKLDAYLSVIVKQYMNDDLLVRRKNLEFLALIAEMLVMAVIAFPLFLVIIITVFGFIGDSGSSNFDILFLLSFIILPMAYGAFYVLIKSTCIEEIGKSKDKPENSIKEIFINNKSSIIILLTSVVIIAVFFVAVFLLNYYEYIEITFYHYFDLGFLSLLLIIGPFGFYSHIKAKKRKELQERFPDFLNSTGNSLSSGMTIFDAIKVSSKGNYGSLTSEIKKMNAELSWKIPIKKVFNNFAERMKSPLISRAVITINRGISMGGNTSNVFKAVSKELAQVNEVKEQRIANMAMYTVVVIMCFFIFLSIMLILNNTLFSYFFDIQAQQTGAIGFISSIDPHQLYYALYSFVFVQGIGSGILGGYMMDGNLSSGVRYGFLLGVVSIFVFKFLF